MGIAVLGGFSAFLFCAWSSLPSVQAKVTNRCLGNHPAASRDAVVWSLSELRGCLLSYHREPGAYYSEGTAAFQDFGAGGAEQFTVRKVCRKSLRVSDLVNYRVDCEGILSKELSDQTYARFFLVAMASHIGATGPLVNDADMPRSIDSEIMLQ
jgi:hypothetical protein